MGGGRPQLLNGRVDGVGAEKPNISFLESSIETPYILEFSATAQFGDDDGLNQRDAFMFKYT